jgi:REP element-mobilizing transposase RayT
MEMGDTGGPRETEREENIVSSQRVSHHRTSHRERESKRTVRQTELVFRSWGGARRGAGRKPKGERAGVPHVSRPEHKARFPLLVTSRLRPGLRSLRHEREAECIRRALVGANRSAARKEPGAAPFQVVHHSIQTNHLHLIVEATDRAALTSGLRGLLVRIARALNRLWCRQGSVFADRFHEHELRSPREVRNALVYVLQNLRKHGIALAGPDPLSSGPEFDGWSAGNACRVESAGSAGEAITRSGSRSRFGGDRVGSASKSAPCAALRGPHASGGSIANPFANITRAARAEVPPAKTWLLGVGWRTHGLIDPRESPRRS